MSYNTRYAARKNREFHARADSSEAMQNRLDLQALSEQVKTELLEKFGEATPANIAEILNWERDRFDALRKERGI